MNKSSLKRKEFLHANSLRQIIQKNIINLYKQGESAAQLAREYGLGYSTVHKWIQGQAIAQNAWKPA